MRAIAYVRVSTEEQARDGSSVAAQRSAITRYADANGIAIVQWAEDLGVSAAARLQDRPAGQGAFALLARRGADALLCTAVDRVFRNVREGLAFVDWAKPRQVRLMSLRENVDTATASGRMALTMTLAVSEFERNVIAERTAQAMAQMQREGKVVGSVPFGCVRDGAYLLRDPATWPTRDRIVQMYRHGLPDGRRVGFELLARYVALHTDLRTAGGKRWFSKATLKSMHDTHDRLSELPLADEVATPATTQA
jgi:site-specific DNA recombinase